MEKSVHDAWARGAAPRLDAGGLGRAAVAPESQRGSALPDADPSLASRVPAGVPDLSGRSLDRGGDRNDPPLPDDRALGRRGVGGRRFLRVLRRGGRRGVLSAHPAGDDAPALDPLGRGAPRSLAAVAIRGAGGALRARAPGRRRLHDHPRDRLRGGLDRARGGRARAASRGRWNGRRARRRGARRGPADRGDPALDSADQPRRDRDEALGRLSLLDSSLAPARAGDSLRVRPRMAPLDERHVGLLALSPPADGTLRDALPGRVRGDRLRRRLEIARAGRAVFPGPPGGSARDRDAPELSPGELAVEDLAPAPAQPGEIRRGRRARAGAPLGDRLRFLAGPPAPPGLADRHRSADDRARGGRGSRPGAGRRAWRSASRAAPRTSRARRVSRFPPRWRRVGSSGWRP